MTARDYMTRVHPDDQEVSEREGKKAIAERGRTNLRQRLIRADGVERIVRTRGKVICDTTGSPVRMVGTVTDVTETERAIEALCDAEEMYRQFLDAIPDMILVKGPKSRIRWSNKAFRDYYGMTNGQLANVIDSPVSDTDLTQRFVKDDTYVFESGKILDIPREPASFFHDQAGRQGHRAGPEPGFGNHQKTSRPGHL
jgi:PAS domain-containing protein